MPKTGLLILTIALFPYLMQAYTESCILGKQCIDNTTQTETPNRIVRPRQHGKYRVMSRHANIPRIHCQTMRINAPQSSAQSTRKIFVQDRTNTCLTPGDHFHTNCRRNRCRQYFLSHVASPHRPWGRACPLLRQRTTSQRLPKPRRKP